MCVQKHNIILQHLRNVKVFSLDRETKIFNKIYIHNNYVLLLIIQFVFKAEFQCG
jgi:hypothetical protein